MFLPCSSGEYISLYHHQRALLQQREIQKNEYIKQLAHDREELQVTPIAESWTKVSADKSFPMIYAGAGKLSPINFATQIKLT